MDASHLSTGQGMKKRLLGVSLALATMASAVVASPVLAWEVEVGDCLSKPWARILEPAGDPWGRIVVGHDRSCKGWVRVPDQDWVDGATFLIAGRVLHRGERAWLPPGQYEGTWSNHDEVEHVDIVDTAHSVGITWGGVGKAGPFRLRYTIPKGCVLHTGWQYLVPETMTWVRQKDYTSNQLLASERVAKAGYYGPLYRGYTKGLTCPAD
jgi:hypothetical protein